MQIKDSPRKTKRLMAQFDDHPPVHFGLKDPVMGTYIDHKDKRKRDAYIARHKTQEDWGDAYSAGALSRCILWGPTPSLAENIRLYKKRFRL